MGLKITIVLIVAILIQRLLFLLVARAERLIDRSATRSGRSSARARSARSCAT